MVRTSSFVALCSLLTLHFSCSEVPTDDLSAQERRQKIIRFDLTAGEVFLLGSAWSAESLQQWPDDTARLGREDNTVLQIISTEGSVTYPVHEIRFLSLTRQSPVEFMCYTNVADFETAVLLFNRLYGVMMISHDAKSFPFDFDKWAGYREQRGQAPHPHDRGDSLRFTISEEREDVSLMISVDPSFVSKSGWSVGVGVRLTEAQRVGNSPGLGE